jgi:hypothetical protein
MTAPKAPQAVRQLDRIEADVNVLKTSMVEVVGAFKGQSRVLWVMTLALVVLAGAEKVLPLFG